MSRHRLLVLGIASCVTSCGSASTSAPELPWLHGFVVTVASDSLTPSAIDTTGAIVVTADLTTADGDETVAVSYNGGVIVRSHAGVVIARGPKFGETGSSDDVVAVAVGDALVGTPLIAVAINRGGHRTSTTSLALFRIAAPGHLDQLFVAPIEERDGDTTVAGSLTMLPASLLYRAPGAVASTVWTFDPARGRYIAVPLAPSTRAVPPSNGHH